MSQASSSARSDQQNIFDMSGDDNFGAISPSLFAMSASPAQAQGFTGGISNTVLLIAGIGVVLVGLVLVLVLKRR